LGIHLLGSRDCHIILFGAIRLTLAQIAISLGKTARQSSDRYNDLKEKRIFILRGIDQEALTKPLHCSNIYI